ncbi:MAG: hypothetical protein GY857_11570, partial [Desulfobacula sp.]|nr:hypothetical protein [Desulfobacula sp.]
MLSAYLSQKEKKKIPLFLIIILITILMIVFYLLFSIIPLSQSIKKIRQKIHRVTGEMGMIEKIIPAYAKARRYDDIEFQHKFPLVNSEILDRDHLPDLLNKFESMATEHNLILLHNKLDIRFMDTQ